MPLMSHLFSGDRLLQACLVDNAAHVKQGAAGEHVSKIHTALFAIDRLSVAGTELRARRYGKSTAAAVLSYKRKRGIINRSYETDVDDIVGKMTIASLDQEMLDRERLPPQPPPKSNYQMQVS